MRNFDTMFVRTAVLILAVGICMAILLWVLQRQASEPAVRTFAVTIADLMSRDEGSGLEPRSEGPAAAVWQDRVLARTPSWRAFADVLKTRLGPGTQVEIRASEGGPVIWVHVPGAPGWISRQIDLPRPVLRGRLLAIAAGLMAVILIGAGLLARQLTGPLRRLEGIADRFAAGDAPPTEPVGGPAEIRHVQSAFVRLWASLQSAEQEREALLAGVSHDLRTPLSRMRFAVGLHGEGASAKLIEELERDLDELEQIAGQFIAYARSNYEEQSAPANLDELVREVLDARAEGVPMQWQGGAMRPLSLEARNVRRLVQNLVENAIRHGKPPVCVRTEQTHDEVTIVVGDAGHGVRAEDFDAALKPFVRFAAQDARGSGLGLAIVDRIARRHNGRVTMHHTSSGFEVRVTLRAS